MNLAALYPFFKKGAQKPIGVRQMFSPQEDDLLRELVREFGDQQWKLIAQRMPNRTTRQCRERYKNYLAPEIKNGPWTADEDQLLKEKYEELGPKWSTIATFFTSRSDVNIKNRWTSISGHHSKGPRVKAYLISMPKNTNSDNNNTTNESRSGNEDAENVDGKENEALNNVGNEKVEENQPQQNNNNHTISDNSNQQQQQNINNQNVASQMKRKQLFPPISSFSNIIDDKTFIPPDNRIDDTIGVQNIELTNTFPNYGGNIW